MADGSTPNLRASDDDRERIAEVLRNALSEGRITLDELEERLPAVYQAKLLSELRPMIADLPSENTTTDVDLRPASVVVPAPEGRIGGPPGSSLSIGILSGTTRKGSWVVPPLHNSFAFWGGVEIDLRSARFAEQRSTIVAVAIMGGIQITVPDDIIVDVSGIGLMGGFAMDDKGREQVPAADAPVVKITGLAFWGGVAVVRRPRKQQQLEGDH